jgi:hypothetical protein
VHVQDILEQCWIPEQLLNWRVSCFLWFGRFGSFVLRGERTRWGRTYRNFNSLRVYRFGRMNSTTTAVKPMAITTLTTTMLTP